MKIIFLSLATGGGHNSAAQATAQALDDLGVETAVFDGFGVVSAFRSKAVCGIYNEMVKVSPRFFGGIYRAGARISTPKIKSIVYAANLPPTNKLARFIEEQQVDGIISTHLFTAQMLTHMKRHGKLACWTGGIMTDYTCQPFWDDCELDTYYTPHADITPQFIKHGLAADTLIPTGIPVAPAIVSHRSLPEAKAYFGYDVGRKHVLVAGGSMGAGKLPEITQALLNQLDRDVQITVVCGNNVAFKEKIDALGAPENRLRVLGYFKPLYELMCSADVLLTKSGGLSSTEAFAQRVPMVIIDPIDGVETENADFFAPRGMAAYPANHGELVEMTKHLLSDDTATAAMRVAQAANVPVDASIRIAKDAIARCRKRAEQ